MLVDTRKLLSVAAVTVLVWGLMACAPEGETKQPDASAVTTSSAPGEVAQKSAKDAGIDLNNLGEPVHTVDIPANIEGDTDATLSVAFYGLRRSAEVLTGTYSFTLHSDSTRSTPVTVYKLLGGTDWTPYLVDAVNLDKYLVLEGSDGEKAKTPTSETDSVRMLPGQTIYAYALFAAPPSDVTTMDAMIVEGAPLAVGVELE